MDHLQVAVHINSVCSVLQHFSGLDEAVYRNIDACMELAKTTRSAYGPNGEHIQKYYQLLFLDVIIVLYYLHCIT